jgi:predicted NAD-dependent protein-ADP-ribosyltransferase YbiA (DUF1768 family)
MIQLTASRKPNGWMLNMSPYPITYKSLNFFTAEHLFIYLRFKEGYRTRAHMYLNKQKNPSEAKTESKKWISKGWKLKHPMMGTEDVMLMDLVLLLKLKQHPDLILRLLLTGDEEIVEDVTKRTGKHPYFTSDLFWGKAEICRGYDNMCSSWVGQNKLGKSWMFIREEIGTIIWHECDLVSNSENDSVLTHNPTNQKIIVPKLGDRQCLMQYKASCIKKLTPQLISIGYKLDITDYIESQETVLEELYETLNL